MIVIVCVDQRNGLAFNGRAAEPGPDGGCGYPEGERWAAAVDDPIVPAAVFTGGGRSPRRRTAWTGPVRESCACGGAALRPWMDRIEGMILNRWDRVYPADLHLDVVPSLPVWHLVSAGRAPGLLPQKKLKRKSICDDEIDTNLFAAPAAVLPGADRLPGSGGPDPSRSLWRTCLPIPGSPMWSWTVTSLPFPRRTRTSTTSF